MNVNRFKYFGLAFALIVGSSGTSVAQQVSARGRITTLDLNSTAEQDRGVCIRMNPEIPYTGGYACLWKDNSLYREISDVFREAYVSGKTCTVASSRSRGRFIEINYVVCQ